MVYTSDPFTFRAFRARNRKTHRKKKISFQQTVQQTKPLDFGPIPWPSLCCPAGLRMEISPGYSGSRAKHATELSGSPRWPLHLPGPDHESLWELGALGWKWNGNHRFFWSFPPRWFQFSGMLFESQMFEV